MNKIKIVDDEIKSTNIEDNIKVEIIPKNF